MLLPLRISWPQVSLAKDSLGYTISWGSWALAGLVPGLLILLTVSHRSTLALFLIGPHDRSDCSVYDVAFVAHQACTWRRRHLATGRETSAALPWQVPAILYVIYPPEVKKTPEAPADARKQLEKLGKWQLFVLLLSHAAQVPLWSAVVCQVAFHISYGANVQ